MNKTGKLDTAPYKGVRDFYPEDMFVLKYLFGKMRETAESFGYVEYGSSVLEPAELYKAKTGEEIVNEQTYSFKDRGERDVTLRPEMTPTLARMIAQKRTELSYPLRWYSIPNLFRYEKPQKGRLREHFQLNVDILGVSSEEAETEIIMLASSLMKNLGAKTQDFEIRINSRKINEALYEKFSLKSEDRQKVSKVIDKKNKISKESFVSALEIILGEKTSEFISTLESNKKIIEFLGEKSGEVNELTSLIDKLQKAGVNNVKFDQTLVRGFDYYTGFVFEIYDTNPENSRSLFGGGRYDKLLEIFGKEPVPAVGFGAGDVTITEFLKSRNLLPQYANTARLYVCRIDEKFTGEVNQFAQKLRDENINVAVDLSGKKISDQIKTADKQKIPFVVCIGENEVKNGKYKVKRLRDGEEKETDENGIIEFLNQ